MSKKTNSTVGVFNKKLAAYTAGAGAAMIAAPGMASADIIWSGYIQQDFGVGIGNYELTMEGSEAEVQFRGFSFGESAQGFAASFIDINSGIHGDSAYPQMVIGLQTTQEVTNALVFLGYGVFTSIYYIGGAWDANDVTGYFGFRFNLEVDSPNATAGTTVYGWAQVERVSPSSGRLLQWAYDDSGAPIQVGVVPEPGTLSLLALGAAGIAALRKRRNGEA